jgi:hypothetical protein
MAEFVSESHIGVSSSRRCAHRKAATAILDLAYALRLFEP